MQEKEFLIAFFKEAGMTLSEHNFNLQVALDVFKARNTALKKLREASYKAWDEEKKLGFEAGEKLAKEQYKDQLSEFNAVKQMTIQELIDYAGNQ